MIYKEMIKQQRWIGPSFAIVLLTLTICCWVFNWFGFGGFLEDPLTAWAAFIGSVVIIGCIIYLLAIFSKDALPDPEAIEAEKKRVLEEQRAYSDEE